MKSFFPSRLAAFLGLIAVLGFAPAHAASVSVVSSAPTTGLLFSNAAEATASTVGFYNSTNGTNQWIGALFIVSTTATTLDKLTLQYSDRGVAAPGAAVTLSIIQMGTTGANDAANITGHTVLQTDHFTLSSTMASSGFLTFDITDITLAPSSIAYGFVLSFDDPAASGRSLTLVKGPAGQGNGSTSTFALSTKGPFRSDNGGGTYTQLGNNNGQLVLIVEGYVGSIIPEPASWATLAGCAALGLVMLRRRRK